MQPSIGLVSLVWLQNIRIPSTKVWDPEGVFANRAPNLFSSCQWRAERKCQACTDTGREDLDPVGRIILFISFALGGLIHVLKKHVLIYIYIDLMCKTILNVSLMVVLVSLLMFYPSCLFCCTSLLVSLLYLYFAFFGCCTGPPYFTCVPIFGRNKHTCNHVCSTPPFL